MATQQLANVRTIQMPAHIESGQIYSVELVLDQPYAEGDPVPELTCTEKRGMEWNRQPLNPGERAVVYQLRTFDGGQQPGDTFTVTAGGCTHQGSWAG